MRMCEIMPAECDDLSIAFHRRKIILVAVVTEKPLHEPRFSVSGIHVENPVEKNLGDVPSFLGDCAGDVTAINANHRVVATGVVNWVRLEEADREHACHEKDDEIFQGCQEMIAGNFRESCRNFDEETNEN